MAKTDWAVQIVAIERVTLRKLESVQVDFEVDRGEFSKPLRLTVNVPGHVDDAAIVPVARNYLAHTLDRLAEQTANWKLTEDAFRELVPEKPTR